MGNVKTDITGMRSGKLTVLEKTNEKRRGTTLWRCRCDCGGEILLEPHKIKNQTAKSCGCSRRGQRMKDLTGRRFGRLTALERLDEKSGSCYLWRCRCDCGKEIKVRVKALLSGNTTSCGCKRSPPGQQLPLHYVDGTCIEMLESHTLRSDNTSGYTGVVAVPGGRWRAQIVFQGKLHTLGTYRDIKKAAEARRKGEERIFGEYLQSYYAEKSETGRMPG